MSRGGDLDLRALDRERIKQLIVREYDSITGIILRLAWQLGLSRQEIHHLEWAQFSEDFSTLTVMERTIPVEHEVGLFFASLSVDEAAMKSKFVVVSPVTQEPITEQYISMLTRKALSSVGMDDVKLSELRSDFILGQMETQPLDYVSRVAGVQYFTLRTLYLPFLQSVRKGETVEAEEAQLPTCEEIEKIIEKEGDSVAGIAIDLMWNTQIPLGELAELTWAQVDTKSGCVRIEMAMYPLSERLTSCLLERKKRNVEKHKNVFLSIRTHRPIDLAYISRMVREVFIKHGRYGMSLGKLRELRREEACGNVEEIYREVKPIFKTQEFVQQNQVSKHLNVEPKVARIWMGELERQGYLTRYGDKYYLADKNHWSADYQERIFLFVQEHPGCVRKEIEDHLAAPDRSAQHVLLKLAKNGKIYRQGWRYYPSICSDTEW